jgi:hypothetical protein
MPILSTAPPKLDVNRMNDITDGRAGVIAHNQLEAALSEILGIKVGTQVSQSVLGTVAADGSITLIRFSQSGVETDPKKSSGFEFKDGTGNRRRLTFTDSKIIVWEYVPATATWIQTFDYEEIDPPKLVELTDFLNKTLTGLSGQIISVQTVPPGTAPANFTLVPNAAADYGAQDFTDLNDVDVSFQSPFGGVHFAGSVLGHAAAVNAAEDKLIPASLAGEGYAIYIRASVAHTLPAGGVWTTIGRWDRIAGGVFTQGAAWDGVPRSGISLARGIYRVEVSRSMASGSSLNKLDFKWNLAVNAYCSTFPQQPTGSEGEFQYVNTQWPPDPWNASWTNVGGTDPTGPKFSSGPHFLIVPGPSLGNFALRAAQNSDSARSMRFSMSITKVI